VTNFRRRQHLQSFNRVIHDRTTRADAGYADKVRPLAEPLAEGYVPNWQVVAIVIHHVDGEAQVIPCIGKKLHEKDPETRQWVRKLKALYPGTHVEVVT
jgi:hypothetical protein